MTNYKSLAVALLSLSASSYFTTNAFVNSPSVSFGVKQQSKLFSTEVDHEIDVRTGKRTGNSFLSEETKERGANGNPIEKAKQAKDGTSAFVDVYEYAAKIRAGELTWKEVVKADLDTVSFYMDNVFKVFRLFDTCFIRFFCLSLTFFISPSSCNLNSVAHQVCRYVAQK